MADLTQKVVREIFNYKNGRLFWKKIQTPNQVKVGDRAGWLENHGYRRVLIYGKCYLEHHIIFLWHHGYLPNKVDHINRRKNNHIDNLREATQSQNMMNTTKRKNTTSQYKGVYYNKGRARWVASITLNGKLKHLGYFLTEAEAALFYNKAAAEMFGDYAHLNNIGGD